MNNIVRNKWQVRVAAAIIFVLGFTAGILALNLYRGLARRGEPRDRLEQLSQRLDLNADQKAKVQQIFSDTRDQLRALRRESEPRVNDIRAQADQKLQQVLTPDQWQRFQKIRSEARDRRGGGRGPRGDDDR
ncbi:MAG TPA: periplasmic heavy metal sensor [Pyrinomonadaceae bacterium]|jgi:Spy/CpxP family protein refolding chaperone